MTDDLVTLTERMSAVLAEENALLDALDLPGAAALLSRKREAVAALQDALSTTQSSSAALSAEADKLRESLQRLAVLGQANRTSIERGLALQTRLIQTIASAVPRGRASESPIYQPDGNQVPPRPPEAYAFMSRM